MTYRMLQMLHLLQAFSAEKWKRAKKSEECAVLYRQVPYFTFWQMMGNLVLPTYQHYKAFARYRFFGQHRREWICVPHKNGNAEAR